MSAPPSPWSSVTLYGVEHSPWVQGIRLALAHHRIPTQLTSVPPGLSWLWRQGPVFPVLQLADGTTHVDSFEMYARLEDAGHSLGMERLSPQERCRAQVELEQLFTVYALGRCGSGKAWRFIEAWSTMREVPFRWQGVLCRAILSLYFWILIQLGIRMTKRAKRTPYDLDVIERRLARWDQRLEGERWLTGAELGFLDFALWGHIQCMTCGLTDELLPIVARQRNLMAWLDRIMETQTDYTPMYARRSVDRSAAVARSGPRERWLFWLAWLGWIMALPLTLVLLCVGFRGRFKNPARSGAVLARSRRAARPRA